jgi:tetratricopeptide (TPR) repeat protein
MRNFERQADSYVFRLFSSAKPLINTFGKIAASSGQAADKPNWHHFSIQQRIDHLSKCETSPTRIIHHDRKVRNSIYAYFGALIILGLAVFQFNQFVFSKSNNELSLATLETYLAGREEWKPKDALLYMMLGNLYYEDNNISKARIAWERGLAINPDNPDILNNLAWLLATEATTRQEQKRALSLAKKAIAIKKAPHIWDTVAECLYVNGFVEEAITAEEEALAMNPEDRHIYEKQLKQYKEALGAK